MTTKINTPHEFALANGWDWTCIVATAEFGVSDVDVEALAETDVSEEQLLTWCRQQVAARQTPIEDDKMYSIDEIYAILRAERIDASAFWAEAAGGDRVPMTGRSIKYCIRQVRKCA